MEELFNQSAHTVALILEFVSVVMIAIGGVAALYYCIRPQMEPGVNSRMRGAWLVFARWMLLGIEFTLAADVVRTAIAPTWDQIGQLASIALIRTFLNFFLERDLKDVLKPKPVPMEKL